MDFYKLQGTTGTLTAPTPPLMNMCNCIGPQNGNPVCPCQMRDVKVVDGRYVMTRDLGPVPWNRRPSPERPE